MAKRKLFRMQKKPVSVDSLLSTYHPKRPLNLGTGARKEGRDILFFPEALRDFNFYTNSPYLLLDSLTSP